MTSKDSELLNALIASGLLGLRGFWKLSSVSKELLSRRDDSTAFGIASVLSGFSSLREREEVWSLIEDSIRRDEVTSLQQVLALKGVAGRYPFLLRQTIDKYPSSRKCTKILIGRGATPLCSEVPCDPSTPTTVTLTAEHATDMLQHGVLPKDSWAIPFDSIPGTAYSTYIPLPSAILVSKVRQGTAGAFDLIGAFLEAGARVDVCGWHRSRSTDSGPFRWSCGRSLLHTMVMSVSCVESGEDETRPHILETRQKGLALLRRIASASKDAGCLDWKMLYTLWEHFKVPGVQFPECTALGLACLYRDAGMVRELVQVTERAERRDLLFLLFATDAQAAALVCTLATY
uniref:Uncharacterized protein n=1 Tax=Chromera velia CCMP2878 TaxID=1169474 RepID=A0A0G4IA03_9ALVE|eukprot:Cvel_12313.t1-p1 / transcript=Cvel_12313.t1 / gene=Cvel_12313 / organism=Chromera_velia_CCMP2878 / gene_product=hypothetical protein / transcript_product=hypothetical protein / location=Cvel_scaffold800:38875-39909(+) / protein_length=345 / sequence_SO=supercontig / SO=protein_coding / is_pseudo=false